VKLLILVEQKPMTRLSVNINKIALIRNARGGNVPNLLQVAQDCERFGAQGVTVHPRPDERHIRYTDVGGLKKVVKTEFNIEGYPSKEWLKLVLENQPDQATLVPDPPGVLTSDTGWDTIRNTGFLQDVIGPLKAAGIRVSVFINADAEMIEAAPLTGTDRIELYTGPFAARYSGDKESAVKPYIEAAQVAHKLKLGINAGHDLNLDNLAFFKQSVVYLDEVSIGHALVSDALYLGLENTIQMYLARLI